MRTEFPAHLLLTPSGGQTGSPAAAPRGRGAAARQMAAFTYSWESPLRRGVWCVCDGGGGGWEDGFVLGRGTYLSKQAYTRTHGSTKNTGSSSWPHRGTPLDLPHPGSTHKSSVIYSLPKTLPCTQAQPPRGTCTGRKVTGSYSYTGAHIHALNCTERHLHSHGNLRKSHNREIMSIVILPRRCVHATAPPPPLPPPHTAHTI